MTPNQAALIIQQSWFSYLHRQYNKYEVEVCFNDLYPERPLDYDGMLEVILADY